MGPENKFIDRVHRRLSRAIFRQKMAGEGRAGTPDYYYEGPGGCLWVEYKVHPNKPTPLQRSWIDRATRHGVAALWAAWHPKKEEVIVNGKSHYQLDEFVRLIELVALEGEDAV